MRRAPGLSDLAPAAADAANRMAHIRVLWRAEACEKGRTIGIPDALIAATAVDQGATVLTRNVRDFALTPVRVETY